MLTETHVCGRALMFQTAAEARVAVSDARATAAERAKVPATAPAAVTCTV